MYLAIKSNKMGITNESNLLWKIYYVDFLGVIVLLIDDKWIAPTPVPVPLKCRVH